MANQEVVASNVTEFIITNEAGQKTFNRRLVVPFSDINNALFTAQGDTVTVPVGDSGDNFIVAAVALNVTTPFATTGTLTADVGTDGDPDNFLVAADVKTAGPAIGAAGALPVTLAGSSGASSDVLQVRFNSQAATGAPADITAGSVEVLLQVINL